MDAAVPDTAPPDWALAEIDALMARGAAFFGSRYAIMGGAMSWVSERHLVAALSNAGAFGVIACGAMEPPRLAEEIAATQALTTRPFGVNLITMHPRLDQLVRTCLDHKVGAHRLRRRHPARRGHQGGQGRGRQGGLLRARRWRWRRSWSAPAPMRW